MRLFAATYLVPISVWDRGTSLGVVMHPACTSLITRCVLSRTPVPVPVSSSPSKRNEAPISTSTSALPPFHAALTRTDLEPRTISRQHRQSLSHSVGRAVPCPCRVVTLTLEPNLLDSKEPAIPPPSLFPTTTLLPSTWVLNPPSFYPASQPASQIYFFSPGTFFPLIQLPACLTSLTSLACPHPARPLEPGKPTCAPERTAPASDWT